MVNQQLTKELQKNKYELDKELAGFKSEHEALIKKDVEIYIKESEALVNYKAEARARLYHAIGPLKFQLLLAARDCKARVTAHPRRPYKIDVSGHYGRSTIYRVARLLCLSELIERQVAYADFAVDKSAIRLLEFKKSLFLILSGSKITCHHPKAEWDSQKEHLFFDVLSTVGSAFVIKEAEGQERCMNFSEFSEALSDNNFVNKIMHLLSVLGGLDVDDTPILWLRLSCLAALCNSLINDLGAPVGFKSKPFDLAALIEKSKDEHLTKRLEKYVQMFQETINEGL